MKTRLFVAALAVTVAGSADAADLGARTYAKAPVALVYDWTGLYIGANAGVGVSQNLTTTNISSSFGGSPTSTLGGAGAIGGMQIGANWQAGNLVIGLETDIQGANLRDDRTCAFTCGFGFALQYDQKVDWFGTARGRIGLATGSVLSYFTGGFAYGNVRTTIAERFFAVPFGAAFSDTRTGWTVGSGVEASLGGNWSGKIEYLYLDLGSQDGGYRMPSGFGPHTYSSDIREHIFRVGANYRFDRKGPAAPEPLANWAGPYVGGNAGSAIALNPSSLPMASSGGVFESELFNLSPRGFIGGAQIGNNWQAGSLVLGLEADMQGSTQKDDTSCLQACVAPGSLFTADQRLQWFGTARGRVGYALGSSLFYATGGLAYGGVKTHVVETFGSGAFFDATFAHTQTGWTVGGGIETAFNPFGLLGRNWTAKTEYLYIDLGNVSDTYDYHGIAHTFSTHVQEHVFRTGLNYHFNSPVVAKY
ncbi:outer membrane beta-barrel protein [Bradyrhizobium iriomotense]|uniref:outer membrane beta-barrel protein n=1 Tax=Bradyrhizobium iriomotense TaxID=441950 RepID=UPI001B8A0EB4|nr:outer membrane beta-barrel protein [Bradyrhizobium iriomotense]MBR0783052.1 porin family protein [Bradyrhizobium iriomotense]